MWKYIARRSLASIPLLIGLSMIIFVIIRILPGDIVMIVIGEAGAGGIREEDRQRLLASLDLDKPLVVQYGMWLNDLGHGRLGESFWRGADLRETMKRRAPVTLEIAIFAVVISWIVGLPVGFIGAIKQDTMLDYVTRTLSIGFSAIPAFWLGVLFILMLLTVWDWVPPVRYSPLWDDPWKNFQMIVFPGLALGLNASAYVARMTRSSVLEVLREDYVRTARAKGLKATTIMTRHVLKNALIPVVTISGITFGFLIGGSVIIESVFAVPGLGTTLLSAIVDRDHTVIQNLVLFYGIIFVIMNLVVDVTYSWLDPRIRYN